MTLIGQHARRSDYVSENSAEGVNNGNVDKIRWCQKVQVCNIFFRFLKNKKHGALRNLISDRSAEAGLSIGRGHPAGRFQKSNCMRPPGRPVSKVELYEADPREDRIF